MNFYGIFLAIFIAAVNADVDCSKRPSFMDIKKCCKVPHPNLLTFQGQCQGQRACMLDCVFNSSNVIVGERIDTANARKMLGAIYSDSPAFADAYAIGLQKCAPKIGKRLAELKAKGKLPQSGESNFPKCQMVATIYFMCAHKYVFIDCPSSAWTSSSTCDNAKEYAIKCDSQMTESGSQRDAGAGANGRLRSGAGTLGGAGGRGGAGNRQNRNNQQNPNQSNQNQENQNQYQNQRGRRGRRDVIEEGDYDELTTEQQRSPIPGRRLQGRHGPSPGGQGRQRRQGQDVGQGQDIEMF